MRTLLLLLSFSLLISCENPPNTLHPAARYRVTLGIPNTYGEEIYYANTVLFEDPWVILKDFYGPGLDLRLRAGQDRIHVVQLVP